MKTALLGYSGFVGQNLLRQQSFSEIFNSKNIVDFKEQQYDLVVCSAIPANMQTANANPQADLEQIKNLFNIIKTARIKKFVLISTIAVYGDNVNEVNEDSVIEKEDLTHYGINRLHAEILTRELFNDFAIIRLPGLFGYGLKKNLIYDLKNLIPSFIKLDSFNNLLNKINASQSNILMDYYDLNNTSNMMVFNKSKAQINNKITQLEDILRQVNFTSLQFTNSESLFQFYNLENLYHDYNIALNNNIKLLNLCSEPILAKDIVKHLTQEEFVNTTAKQYKYDMHSKHATIWNKKSYQYDKDRTLEQLKVFYNEFK